MLFRSVSSNEAAQVVGTLRQLEKQYGLTEQESTAAFNTARILAGAATKSTDKLKFSTEQYAQILESLPLLAKGIAGGKRDPVGEANRKGAAGFADAKKREEAELGRQRKLDAKLLNDLRFSELTGLRQRVQGTKILSGVEGNVRTELEEQLDLQAKIRAAADARLKLDRERAKTAKPGIEKTFERKPKQIKALELELNKALLAVDQRRAEIQDQRLRRSREEYDLWSGVQANAVRALGGAGIELQRGSLSSIGIGVLRDEEQQIQRQIGRAHV